MGEENGLRIRIYGERGGVAWLQVEPNTLVVHRLDRSTEIRRAATAFVGAAAAANVRLPAGHPEGYIEGFANIYNSFADALATVIAGGEVDESTVDYPNVHDGVRGMAFLEAVVESGSSDQKWVPMPV